MKKTAKCFLCLMSIAVFSACTNENESLVTDDGTGIPMKLLAQMLPIQTRATVDNVWNGNEQISVSDGNNAVTYRITDANGSMQVVDADNPLYWASALEAQEVKAWYPATANNVEPTTWSVEQDQSTMSAFQASDMLYVSTEVALQGNKTLPLEHVTAKVIVNLKGDGSNEEALENAIVTIENTLLNATVSDGSLTAVQETPQTMIPYTIMPPISDNLLSYQMLMVPQSIEGKTFIKIQTASDTYVYQPKVGEATFQGGYKYIYNITVGKPGIAVEVIKSNNQWGNDGEEKVNLESIPAI